MSGAPRITGQVTALMQGADGSFEHVAEAPNTFTASGVRALVTMAGLAPGDRNPGVAPNAIALGNGIEPSAFGTIGNRDRLISEVIRKPLVSRGILGDYSVRYTTTFATTEAVGTVTEMGLFGNSTVTSEMPITGVATATSQTTLTDASRTWAPNQWTGYTLYLPDALKVAYAVGTAYQSGTGITGTNTLWTSALVGGRITFPGYLAGTVTSWTDATHMTVSSSQTVAVQAYSIGPPMASVHILSNTPTVLTTTPWAFAPSAVTTYTIGGANAYSWAGSPPSILFARCPLNLTKPQATMMVVWTVSVPYL